MENAKPMIERKNIVFTAGSDIPMKPSPYEGMARDVLLKNVSVSKRASDSLMKEIRKILQS